MSYVEQLRADQTKAMRPAQKLATALQKAANAEKVAYGASRSCRDLENKLERALVKVFTPNRQAQVPSAQDDSPSIFDD